MTRVRTPIEVTPGARGRTAAFRKSFLRTFAVQGSWNYRTMIGSGFGFVILPLLRRIYRDDPTGLAEAVTRHSEHFNAHPYLTGLAVGAVGRMEKEGASPEMIRRFKLALKGPLGSLGDRLVWAKWLPFSGSLGVVVAILSPWWWAGPLTFFLVYNAGHVALRYWAFRTGVEEGRGLGSRIRDSGLSSLANRLGIPLALTLGALVGLILGRGAEAGLVPWPWLVPGAVLFAVGLKVGDRSWRPAVVTFFLLLVAILVVGRIS